MVCDPRQTPAASTDSRLHGGAKDGADRRLEGRIASLYRTHQSKKFMAASGRQNLLRANAFNVGLHHITRDYWADPFTGSRHDDIARLERIEPRRPGNLLRNKDDHFRCVGYLPVDAIYLKTHLKLLGVGNFIGGYKPGSVHRVRVDRFAHGPVFSAANSHVQGNGIASDV